MKKLLLTLLLIASLIIPSSAFADWTCVAKMDKGIIWGQSTAFWQYMYRVMVTCTGDGSDVAEMNLSDILEANGETFEANGDLKKIAGGALYKIHTGPGSQAPDDALSIGIDGDLGEDWQTVTTTSAATKFEEWSGGSKIVWDIQIDFPDIGDANDVIVIYFTIAK